MAGYQLLVSRAKVTQGETVVSADATVSVRAGVATIKGAGVDLTGSVVTIEKARRSATITLDDGTIWTVARKGCGCGGGR